MSHDRLRRPLRIGLGALALLAAAPALAADLAYPYPAPPEPGPDRVYREERLDEEFAPPPTPHAGPPPYGPRFAPPPPDCRTVVKRRIDEFGEEAVRRVRICDEAGYPPPPRPHLRPSLYDPGPPVLPPSDVPDGPFDEPPGW